MQKNTDNCANEVLSFQVKIKDFSVEELESLQNDLNEKMARMVYDKYIVEKVALVQSLIEEKKGTN